jgi:ABC-type Fe3+/spermidine/putrescine transport system ATPase subunit
MLIELDLVHDQVGITFIFVTHDQGEAMSLADRVAVMNEGRIEQLGSPSDLYDRPTNRFVAAFIGESNFLKGKVTGANGTSVTVDVGGAAVTAISVARPAVGASVVLAIRPEKILFAETMTAARSPEINTLTALVRDVAFVGEMHRYVLEIAPDSTIVVKQQHRFPVRPRAPSERATIEWHVQDTLIV